MTDFDVAYVKGLLTILKKHDVDALRDFLAEEARARDPEMEKEIESISDEELEIRMHKMILARPELGEIHAGSRRWLREHTQEVRY